MLERRNYEECVQYLLKAIKLEKFKNIKENSSELSLCNLIIEKKIGWRIELHPYWFPMTFLNEVSYSQESKMRLEKKIVVLFLISKHKNLSSSHLVKSTFIKGIIFQVVKHLCDLSLEN